VLDLLQSGGRQLILGGWFPGHRHGSAAQDPAPSPVSSMREKQPPPGSVGDGSLGYVPRFLRDGSAGEGLSTESGPPGAGSGQTSGLVSRARSRPQIYVVLGMSCWGLGFLQTHIALDVAVHTCDPSTWGVEAGGFQIWGQIRLHGEILTQKLKTPHILC
jgi:hypothetical protein